MSGLDTRQNLPQSDTLSVADIAPTWLRRVCTGDLDRTSKRLRSLSMLSVPNREALLVFAVQTLPFVESCPRFCLCHRLTSVGCT